MSTAEWELRTRDGRLELIHPESPDEPGLAASFVVDRRAHAPSRSKKQPLARALGRESRRVLDATAGLGYDAILMASIGFDVVAVERHPLVHALFEDGLRRARENSSIDDVIVDRVRAVHDEGAAWLDREPWDVVYIDPMFPPRKKRSALPRKRIQWLRALVGSDDDAADLLRRATACCRRVVVKRADDGPPLGGIEPAASLRGKIARYDVIISPGR